MIRRAVALLFMLGCALARAETAGPRAIWVWEEDSYAMLEQPAAAIEAIAFLKSRSIGTVFLYADAHHRRNLISSRPELYRRFVRRAHASGMQVYALLGSGELHTERYVLPAHRGAALAMLQRVLDYNKAAAVQERFDGVNLDIEPHILDEWDSRKMELLADFVDLSDAFMRAKRKSGLRLQVGPAMPFWFDGIELEWRGKRRPVSQHLQDLYDYVALMDYRDHADGGDGLVAHAMDELSYADAANRRVLIGVETSPNEIRKVSFNHLPAADMERELARAQSSFHAHKSYGGYVIHHYRAWRKWLGAD